MELLLPQPTLQRLFLPSNFMYPLSLSSKLLPKSLLFSPQFRLLCSSSLHLNNPSDSIPVPNGNKRVWRNGDGSRVCEAKEKWLSSLSSPFPFESEELCDGERNINGGGDWVVGVDPDASGALALLKPDRLGCSAEVFDSPYVQVSVGKRTRRRLDAKSIVELVQSFNAPKGTTAYIEQSNPYPKDGKQGWWSGGFGYGLWIGILVASGFSVVPVPSQAWKKAFDLAGSCSSKDNSRRLASDIFPMLSPMLKRKKDHGRAEALLIAVYGKGLKTKVDEYESQL